MNDYFSDSLKGSAHNLLEDIPGRAWDGIVSLITTLINNGAFGQDFPEGCPDNPAMTIGTNEKMMGASLNAEIPGLDWPLRLAGRVSKYPEVEWPTDKEATEDRPIPALLDVLDLIQFCYRAVAKPLQNRGSDLGF